MMKPLNKRRLSLLLLVLTLCVSLFSVCASATELETDDWDTGEEVVSEDTGEAPVDDAPVEDAMDITYASESDVPATDDTSAAGDDSAALPESVSEALTPDGNLTLVDDYTYTSDTGTVKQFITLVTKSGNYFYLIIDRDDEGDETVHFLNQVDEADLLALMDEDQAEAYEAEQEAALEAETEAQADHEITGDSDTTSENSNSDAATSPNDAEQNTVITIGGLSISSRTLPGIAVLALAAIGGIVFLIKKISGRKKASADVPDPDADYNDPGYDFPEDTEDTTPDD